MYSAANALACRCDEMAPKELRELEYTVVPLLDLLRRDLDNPVANKAAYGIRSLMRSRICMSRFIDEGGLQSLGKTLDTLLGVNMVDMHSPSNHRSVLEHLAVCYREIARFYPWQIIKVGALRHCVSILRFGDIELQTIAYDSFTSYQN